MEDVLSVSLLAEAQGSSRGSHDLPQNPVSKPTEKQLLSLLKVDESENGPTDSSMTCRVFIFAG